MSYHKCAEPGCGFHLPDDVYPYPYCPWHFVPEADAKTKVLVIAGAFGLFALGYGVSKAGEWWKDLKARKKMLAAQEQWRDQRISPPDEITQPDDADIDSDEDVAQAVGR